MATTTAPLAPAVPAPSYLAVLGVLATAGYTTQTSLAPVKGAYLVWFAGPAGVAGFHGHLFVGARSGRVTRAQLLPRGESGPVRNVRGSGEVHDAVADALRQIVLAGGGADERAAAARGDVVPATGQIDGATAEQPRYGDLVHYHGSQGAHHGVWRYRGRVPYGEDAGRVVLVNPDDRRQTLILSLGSTSITRLP